MPLQCFHALGQTLLLRRGWCREGVTDNAVHAVLQSAQSGSGGDEGADEVGEAFFRPHASRRGDQDDPRR